MKIMTTITRFTSAARTRATSARVLTAAFALVGAGALALIACHPDDVVAPADGEMITLSATAALPGAGITAGGTASRAAASANRAATSNGTATNRATTRAATTSRDVYFADDTEMDITLNKYTGSSSATATAYAYTLTPTSASEATSASIKPMPAFSTAPDATIPGGISVPSGSTVYLGIPQMQMELKMKLQTEPGDYGNYGSETVDPAKTALVPFHTRMEMQKAAFTASSTALTLPLTYTTAALRLKLVITDGVKVATATCPNLPMADGATRSLTPTRTDGLAEADAAPVTHQTAIFGELTPGNASTPSTTLAEGDIIALLKLADVQSLTNGATTPGRLLAVKCPASLAGTTVPAAGQMMTLTVRVDATTASITDDVEIDGFEDGNGGGIVIGSAVTGDGTQALDANIFNADHPYWIITGTETNHVITRLKAVYDANSAARIYLQMPDVTTVAYGTFNYCTSLAAISLPAATEIGEAAFYNCSNLTTASLPAAQTIKNNAFNACNYLTTANLPVAQTIMDNAFSACTSLAHLSLPAATAINACAFDACNGLTDLSLPAMTTIHLGLFATCTDLVKLDISGVTSGNNIDDEIGDQTSGQYLPNPPTPASASAHEVPLREFFFPAKGNKGNDGKGSSAGKGNSSATTRTETATGATFNTAACDLIVSQTLYDSSAVTSDPADGPKNTLASKKWKSITPKPAP